MKTIIEFNLPEEKSEYLTAINGQSYYVALADIKRYYRSKLKYDSDKNTKKEIKLIQNIANDIYDIIKELEYEEVI